MKKVNIVRICNFIKNFEKMNFMYVNVIKYYKYCTVQSIETPQEFFLPKCCDH